MRCSSSCRLALLECVKDSSRVDCNCCPPRWCRPDTSLLLVFAVGYGFSWRTCESVISAAVPALQFIILSSSCRKGRVTLPRKNLSEASKKSKSEMRDEFKICQTSINNSADASATVLIVPSHHTAVQQTITHQKLPSAYHEVHRNLLRIGTTLASKPLILPDRISCR